MGPALLTLEFPAGTDEFLAAFAARKDPPLRPGSACFRPPPGAPAFAPPLPCAPEELAPELVALVARASRWSAAETAARLAPLYAAHNGLIAGLARPVAHLTATYPWPAIGPETPAFATLASLLSLWLRELRAHAPAAAIQLSAGQKIWGRLDPLAPESVRPRPDAPALADFISPPQAPAGPWRIREFSDADTTRLPYHHPRFPFPVPLPAGWIACSADEPERWHGALFSDGATLCFPPPVAGADPKALAALVARAVEATPAPTNLFHPDALPPADPRVLALRAAGFVPDREVEFLAVNFAQALALLRARQRGSPESPTSLGPDDHAALSAFVSADPILSPAQLGADAEAPAYHPAYSFTLRETDGTPRTVLLVRAPAGLAQLHLLYLCSHASTPHRRALDTLAVLSAAFEAALRDGWTTAWFTSDGTRRNLHGWLHPSCCTPHGSRVSHRLPRPGPA